MLVQLSRQSCPPCQSLKQFVLKEQKINSNIEYLYVDIDFPSDETNKLLEISRAANIRSLPILFLAKEEGEEVKYELLDQNIFSSTSSIYDFLSKTFGDSSLAELNAE